MLKFLLHCERHGRTPTGWLEKWAKEVGVGAQERVYHELRILAEVLEYAACYDQLNIGNLFCLELAARRWEAVVDAYATNAGKPNYDAVALFNPLGRSVDGVPGALRAHVAKKAKEEAEIEKQRVKARELRGGAPPQKK